MDTDQHVEAKPAGFALATDATIRIRTSGGAVHEVTVQALIDLIAAG